MYIVGGHVSQTDLFANIDDGNFLRCGYDHCTLHLIVCMARLPQFVCGLNSCVDVLHRCVLQ